MIGVAVDLSMKWCTENERKWRGFGGIKGAMKGKMSDQISLGSLGQLGSLVREIWERMRFQI